MPRFLNCNDISVISELKRMGLNEKAIYKIFFGPSTNPPLIDLMPGTPNSISQIIRRLMLASEPTFRSIPTRQLCMPNVWTGEPMATDIGFATPSPSKIPIPMFPLFYNFSPSKSPEFWLVSFSWMSAITHIIIPSIGIVLFNGEPNFVEFIWNTFREYESDFRQGLAYRSSEIRPKTIGLIDQLPNYAHQLINHLSGLERLIENTSADELDEIWIVGIEFFGKIESYYPSLSTKLRRFSSRDRVSDLLLKGHYMPYRLGCGIFRRRLRSRIIKIAAKYYKVEPRYDRFPLIGVTIREQGRRCINLEAVICRIMSRLSPLYPRLAFVLDGWVRPECSVDEDELVLDRALSNVEAIITQEQIVADRIIRELPKGAVIRNLIGLPMLQSIIGISDNDIYLANVGTLQHKIGFFSCSPGVVHGPTIHMSRPAYFHFLAEEGTAPTFLPEDVIVDGPNNYPARGPGYCDYEIADPDQVVSLFEEMLAMHQA